MHFNTVITGNVEADLFHNHKIMTVSSLLLDAQSDLVYITSIFFVKHFGCGCGNHGELAFSECMENPLELEKGVIGEEVNISKALSIVINTKLKKEIFKDVILYSGTSIQGTPS